MLRRACALADAHPDPLVAAGAANGLGIWCKDTGRYEGAQRHYLRARTLLEERLGSNYPHLASAWHNPGRARLRPRGQYAEGETAARRRSGCAAAPASRTPPMLPPISLSSLSAGSAGSLDEAQAL